MRRSARSRRPTNDIRTKSFVLKGGMNMVDAPIKIPDGMILAGINYELLTSEGYRRLAGIERYDGRAKPTDATYYILNYDNGTVLFVEGDTVTGLTSGATAEVLSVWGTAASGYIVISNLTGTFQDNEQLQVGGANRALANGVAAIRGASTPALDATYAQDAIETQRAKILKVGSTDGSGRVRGVQVYNNNIYAFRNNAAGTACLMWKSTTAGWVQQALGRELAFTSGGVTEIVVGNTITGAISAATAVITRVVLTSGTWAAGTAAGRFIFASQTGTFQAENLDVGASLNLATIAGNSSAITLLPGGRFEFENYNFFGSSTTYRMYGCDGVNRAFEWDGAVFVPITTGNAVDTPSHIAINEYHLMLAFANGSLQNSATGEPYVWAGGGAAEIGCGDPIIGMNKEVGTALAVICRNRTFMLHGKNTTDSPWDLKTVSDKAGGIEWSVQNMGVTRFMDDRGFTQVAAVQEYGDFNSSVYSQLIEPLVEAKKNMIISSLIVKGKSQYRLFFSDGTGIIATFNDKKLSGFTTFRLIDINNSSIVARCTANGEDSTGNEILFMGDDNGWLFEIDQGTSFDGGPVAASMVLVYCNCGSPSQDKQFKKVTLEADGSAGTIIEYNVLLDYSSGRSPSGITLYHELAASGAVWNAAIWNAFNWASEDVTLIEGNIDGVGRNIALQLASSSTYTEPHTLYSVTYHYKLRKLVR